jgi:putative phosphoribosyl transferase
LLIVKKIQIPWSTEAGMGAVTPDGQIFLNKRIINSYSINDKELGNQVSLAKQKINDLRKEFDLPNTSQINGKRILVVDDGIASGFSMLAGSEWLKSLGAEKIIIGVPTAPYSSLFSLEQNKLDIYCLNVREGPYFAVAEAYTNWYDLSVREAKEYINKLKLVKSDLKK